MAVLGEPGRYHLRRGECMLRLGQADQAVVVLEEGIALFDESFVRDRQLFSIHLADALARPGKQRDLDAAVSRGMEAIRLPKAWTPTGAQIFSATSPTS